MGYIKKLKNNELVGGTDKTTVYPVTSTKAVFEEVSENNFQSQEYLNNHITNERIVDNTIENSKLKDDTIDMGKLNTQLKTIIQNAYDASWKVKEEPFSLETKYDADDVVYDPDTNSSYVSLTADNQGNPVNPEDEGYVEGKWRVVINGISAIESTEVIDAKVTELETRVDNKIEELDTEVDNKINDAQEQLDAKIADVQVQLDAVTQEATDAALEARDAASTVETLTSQQVADAQVGYFECTDTSASGAAANETKITTTATIGTSTYTKVIGSHVKIKMAAANTHAAPVYLQFGNQTNTKAPLLYNGEAVSASNTWESGEVISVYYDGTVYQASNAFGGSNKKIDNYLYGDLRTLALGQTYKFDESVKTTDKQFLRITKDVTTLRLSEVLVIGDLKVNSNKTYRADKAINVYDPEGDYTENPYALGSLAEYTLTVTAENVVECTITVNGTEIPIDEGEEAASIATKIVSALGEIEGWTISRNEAVITIKCNTIGANTTTITISGTEETGITIDNTLIAGTNVIRKYDGTSWTNAVVADLVTDEVLIEVDAAWLAANAAKQNTIAKDFYDVEINFKVDSKNCAISPARQGANKWYSGSQAYSYFVPIESGVYYMITANATTWVSFLKNNVSGSHNSAVTNFATGETACHTIGSGKSVILKAPFDAKYLLVTYYNYGDITPKSVIKVSLFNVFNKADFINFDNTTSKIESNSVQGAIVEVLNIADLADKRGVYKLTSADCINNRQVSGGAGAWVYARYNTGYLTSKPIYLHKGDTVSLASFGTYHSTCAFAEWHMNNYKVLVTYNMWAEGAKSYTAERDMFVCVSGLATNNLGAVTVVRNSILINNLANYHYDDNHNDYFYRLFGEIRVPTFTVTEGKYIKDGSIVTDIWSLYTSPIFLSKGESIFVSFPGGFASGNSVFTLSDAEGNPISGISSTTRSGFGKYPTIYMYQAIEDCYVIISGRGRYILPYIVSDSVLQSYFNRIEGEAKGDIMSLWGTTETLLKLRQLNRPYNSHNSVGVEGPADRVKGAYNPWIIIHFSDIHNDGTNLRRIETFADYYKQQTDHLNTGDVIIDDVLDTGDNVLATAGGGIPWNTSNIAATFLNTIGNHDIENMNNFTFDGLTGWPAVYKKQMGQFRSQWGNVVFPDENVEEEGKCYYYKDYTSQNIRLIVLMNWSNTTAAYMSNEYAWFKDVLDDALAKNLTVVCAGHVKPANLTPIDGCTFHAHEYGYETQSNASQFVILVDKFIRAGGTFACWLAGHTHYDLTGWVNAKYTEDGIEHIVDNQLCLVVENAGGQGSDFERRYWNSDNRIAGTKSQDCFNIVCVNAAYYRVSVMRIGSQYDNSGQHKGGFCINYKTKKMLSCY